MSDEEEVVDRKAEIENSCKPQCIKQLLAVRLDCHCLETCLWLQIRCCMRFTDRPALKKGL